MKKFLLSLTVLFSYFNVHAQLSCASPTVITQTGSFVAPAVTGTYATTCYNSPTTDAGGVMNGIWYSFTPATSGQVTINSNLTSNVAPLSNDTRLSVFTGTCAALVCYDGSDDVSATNFLTTLTFNVGAGTTYYIQWDNFWNGASFNFDFTFTSITCLPPSFVTANTNVTTNSITLGWEASLSNPAGYDVEYGLSGFTQGTGTIVSTETNSLDLSGLVASGVYDYYVRSNCGAEQSSYTAVNTFALAKTCPYSSGLDDNAQLAGWTTAGNAGDQGLGNNATLAQSPAGYWIMNTNATAAVNNWLFSPAFFLQAGEEVSISFWQRSAAARSLRVTVGSDNDPVAQTTQLYANTALTNNVFGQINVPAFVAPTTGIYYFGWNDISPAAAVATMRLDTFNFTSVLGTNNFLSSNLSVYPNPTKDIIYVNNNLNAVVNSIEMSDLNGRVVKTQIINAAEGQVSISDLAAGVYMMKVITDQGTADRKSVV